LEQIEPLTDLKLFAKVTAKNGKIFSATAEISKNDNEYHEVILSIPDVSKNL
jgi:hypothetical protein